MLSREKIRRPKYVPMVVHMIPLQMVRLVFHVDLAYFNFMNLKYIVLKIVNAYNTKYGKLYI